MTSSVAFGAILGSALVFGVAGVMKLASQITARSNRTLTIVAALLECLVASLVCLNRPVSAGLLGAALFVCFGGFRAFRGQVSVEAKCRCFGNARLRPRSVRSSLAFGVLLAIFAPFARVPENGIATVISVAVAIICVAVVVTSDATRISPERASPIAERRATQSRAYRRIEPLIVGAPRLYRRGYLSVVAVDVLDGPDLVLVRVFTMTTRLSWLDRRISGSI